MQENDRLKTWSLLNLFSGAPVDEMLRGPLIDLVENVIPLQADHHEAFGSMRLWYTDRRVQTNSPTGIFILISG